MSHLHGSLAPDALRATTRGTRAVLLASSGLVAVAALQLLVLGRHTDRWFAWTIDSPLTAAWLGANYGASFVLQLLASRERVWVHARVAVPGVLAFTALTAIVTLNNAEYLHWQSPLAWIWVAVYVVAPVATAGALAAQRRAPGRDPPRASPLPRWLHCGLVAEAAVLAPLGAALFAAPAEAGGLWPWSLANGDDSMAPYVGAWLIGLGAVAAHAAWEDDARRALPVCASQLAAGALHALVLGLHASALDWHALGVRAYAAFVVAALASGLAGTLTLARRPPPLTSPSPSPTPDT